MSTVKTCRHILPTGRTCKSPAMRGMAYCYNHGPQKSPRRISRATEQELEIGPIAEPADVSFAAGQILLALASNQISKGRAAIMFQGLQTILASYRIPSPDDSFNPDSLDPSSGFGAGLDPTPSIESLLHHFGVPAPTGHGPAK